MANKDFKVKNKLVISGLTNANGVLLAENHAVDSHTNLATQYGGTGTTTSPTSGQIPYSVSGTTYTPTALNTLDVKGSSYSADAPSSPVVGQIWVESDSTSDSFDPNIIRRKSFTATAAQTVFTTDLEFIQGYEQVFFNGMLLLRNSDYTTASNTNVTLASGAAEGDIVEIVTVTNLNSVNTYTQGEIDTALSAKLSTSTAASTYLTQSNAATTYVPQSNYFVAGKNKVINGDFKIWQRGAGAFTSSNVYTADRWVPGANQPFSISRQNFTPGTAPVAGYEGQHFLRIALTASSSTYFVLIQKIEDIRTFAGQTVTLSYWAKADANVTNTASYERSTNSATLDSSYAASNVIGTTWQRYTATFNVPTISGATVTSDSFFGIKPILIQDGLAHTIDIWGVQVEAGSTATPFQTATGTLQGELAACQRYFYKTYNLETAPGTASTTTGSIAVAQVSSGANANWISCRFPVAMRTTPTVTLYNPETGTTGQVRNLSSSQNVPASESYSGSMGFNIYITGASGGVGYVIVAHATASAEI
jgi:hypothetical protein